MSIDMFGCAPGPSNSLLDVPGIVLGHAICDDGAGDSGVSVIIAPEGAVASVDVRGGGPGTRETDLLEPHNTVEAINAIALCGGSAFGLDAAGGVMAALEDEGIGFPVLGSDHPEKIVPIVPAAVIFDLLLGDWRSRPTAATGTQAVRAALSQRSSSISDASALHSGNLGAGLAASAGALKGGFGQASAIFPAHIPGEAAQVAGYTVAVGVVANPQGAVFDPATGRLWGFEAELADEFGESSLRDVPTEAIVELAGLNVAGTKFPRPDGDRRAQLNTTIGVVATDAPISKAQSQRLALASHDGLSRAIRPSHMPMDGDTLFALSTAAEAEAPSQTPIGPVGMTMLSATAANCVERAIVHAVLGAQSAYDTPSWSSIVERADRTSR